MNIYTELNQIIEYTEIHLDEKIEYKKVAQMIGLNEYTFQKVFLIISNISYPEYIRNRRLSNAGQEIFLDKYKVIDIAVKYNYTSATSFSRAFEKFHGIKPSEVKKNPEKLRLYTKLHFDEKIECNQDINYQIVERDEIILYGNYIQTDNVKIKQDAPKFYAENAKKYGEAPYGMIEYCEPERLNAKYYWVLYQKREKGFKKKIISKSKWIQIRIDSQNAKEIQRVSDMFYTDFLPNSKYSFRDLPEIEYYHDNITDFLIPIED